MDTPDMKEVYFDIYCPTCKYEAVDTDDEPCTFCLDTPARENSHKPEKWEEK